MHLFPGQGLAESIILELRQGSLETAELIHQLQARGRGATKQGVYKALRQLREDQIVFLQAGEASLSVRWLERLNRFISLTQHAYAKPSTGTGNFLNLADGDRITYTFKDPVSVDAFWNHALYILLEAHPTIRTWHAYAPHCWYLLARRTEELALYRNINKHGARVLYTVRHGSALDRLVAKEFDGNKTQYYVRDKPLITGRWEKHGIVLNVLSDFIIQAEYEPKIVELIDRFYRVYKTFDTKNIVELERIVSMRAKIKLTIMRDQKKAKAFVKRLSKPFYTSQDS